VLSLLLYGGPFVLFGLRIMRVDPAAGFTFATAMVTLATVIVRAAEHQRLWDAGL
jgi:hypothetical protein